MSVQYVVEFENTPGEWRAVHTNRLKEATFAMEEEAIEYAKYIKDPDNRDFLREASLRIRRIEISERVVYSAPGDRLPDY